MAPTTLYIILFSLLSWCFVLSTFLFHYRQFQFRSKHNCKPPPAAKQNPLLLGFEIPFQFVRWLKAGTFLEETRTLSRQNGRTHSIRMLGDPTIWTTEPDNIKAILATRFADFELSDSRLKAFRPYTGDGIFSSNGEKWSHGRAILRPSLAKTHISNLEMYEVHFQNLAALIPRDGSTIDLQALFNRMTIDTASDFLFGESVHALDPNQSTKAVNEAFNYTTKALAFRIQMGPLALLFPDPKFKKSVNLIHEYVDYFVDKAVAYRSLPEKEAEEGKAKKYMFLRELAKDTGDRKVLRDQLVSILAAGRDTTAALLSLSFWLLLRHPRVLGKLRKEIEEFGNVPISYDHLKGMKYLRWILDETLRLYPVVPLNERCAKRDSFLPTGGGRRAELPAFVRKNQIVIYNAYAMHRDPDLWGPDADEFRPERWENLRPGYRYIPFGGGPRICPGQQLALTEAGYTIVRLLQTFRKVESRDDEPFHENVGIIITLARGVQVSLMES